MIAVGGGLVVGGEPLAVKVAALLAEGEGDVELEDGGLEEDQKVLLDLSGVRSVRLSSLLEQVGIVLLGLIEAMHHLLDAGISVELSS